MAVVTAFMLIAGAQGGQAGYTLTQLQDIERLILARDCGALWTYLSANGDLLEGDDPLAVELRKFALGIENGLIACLSVGPGNTPGLADIFGGSSIY
jgi:hypothetical protein